MINRPNLTGGRGRSQIVTAALMKMVMTVVAQRQTPLLPA